MKDYSEDFGRTMTKPRGRNLEHPALVGQRCHPVEQRGKLACLMRMRAGKARMMGQDREVTSTVSTVERVVEL